MLFQESAIEHVLVSSGQLLVPLDQFALVGERISQGIFIPVLSDYVRWRPIRKTLPIEIVGTNAFTLPSDFGILVGVKPNWWSTSYAVGVPGIINAPLWADQMEIEGNLFRGPPGLYRFEYFAKSYTLKRDWANLEFDLTTTGVNKYTLKIPAQIQPTTLVFFNGDDEAQDDGAGTITGPFLTGGTVDYKKGEVTLNSNTALTSPILGEFHSVVPGVVELDLGHTLFLDMFAVKLIRSLAQLKAQMKIEGLEFDVDADRLQEFADKKEEEIEDQKSTHGSWWEGVS